MDIEKRLKRARLKAGKAKVIKIIAVITIFSVLGIGASEYIPEAMANEYEGIIRFHVIAHSDSDEDQKLKLLVRDCVIVKLQNALEDCSDIGETREYIEENLDKIELWASECVKSLGYDYEIAARLGVTAIPAKRYEDVYFPAGNYEALTITIGEGKGQNWWCVVFPPLCLIDSKDEAAGELSDEDAEGKIVLKSKLLEILRRGK